MEFVPDKSASLHEWNAFLRCGKGVSTLWKRGQHPVEKGSAPCGNGEKPCGKRVSTLWKGGQHPVETGQSIGFFLFQLLIYPLPTCTILSQAAEKYDSKMFIRSKIMGNREDYEKKPEVITAIGNDRIKTPHHIPVDGKK